MQRTVLFYAFGLRLMYTKIQMITYQLIHLNKVINVCFFFIYRTENENASI